MEKISEGLDELYKLYGMRICEWAIEQEEFMSLDAAWHGETQSPIERRLLMELLFAEYGYGTCRPQIASYNASYSFISESLITIVPQFPVGAYRLDLAMFARWTQTSSVLRVAIECDGHDFHERTKGQAAHDKKRDRFITAQGFTCFRFTGSEIFHEGRRCAQEIAAFVGNWFSDQEHGFLLRLRDSAKERA